MNESDWERALTAHFLRSDGPFGEVPLTFIDAAPEELAAAAHAAGFTLGPTEARESFISQFDVASVQMWLSGSGGRPRGAAPDLPGYFRYLVLTCFVGIDEAGDRGTNNFRVRLGRLLGRSAALQSVSGVNQLWKRLEAWCAHRRSEGGPFRQVILPDPGRNMSLIGIAVRMAYPNWRDRAAFAKLLASINSNADWSAKQLVTELRRPQNWLKVPTAIKEAALDFTRLLEANHRLLRGHRFWSVVERIWRTAGEGKPSAPVRQSLEIAFGGYEGDEIDLMIFNHDRSIASGGPPAEFEGSPSELIAANTSAFAPWLRDAIKRRTFVFAERGGGSWLMDRNVQRADTVVVLYHVEADAAASLSTLMFRQVEGGWRISDRTDGRTLPQTILPVRSGAAEDVMDLLLVGGVALGRSSRLGRRSFLPEVVVPPSAALAILPLSEASGTVSAVEASPGRWRLDASGRCTGRWKIVAKEDDNDLDCVITLEADAPERATYADVRSDYQLDFEELIAVELPLSPGREVPTDFSPQDFDGPFWDILEAIYASAPERGWPEGKLVQFLIPRLPSGLNCWDFLRCLAEGSWLNPVLPRRWRGRRWMLSKPSLISVSGDFAVVEGAHGELTRRRYAAAAKAVGAELVLAEEPSPWRLPILCIRGAVSDFAAEVSIPLRERAGLRVSPAPDCWRADTRSTDGRYLAGVWDNETLTFAAPQNAAATGPVRLERWLRERSDDLDVFRICQHGKSWLTVSRTAALLEFCRVSSRPMFGWSDGQLLRVLKSGYLPLRIGRHLRTATLRASGPVTDELGCWKYRYAARAREALWLASIFGAAIGGVDHVVREGHWLKEMSMRRHAGSRQVWPPGSTRRGSP